MKIIHKTGTLRGADQINLFYQYWKPVREGGKRSRAVLVFIHGMAEHSDRYQHPTKYFTDRGFAVYAMDLRGHGSSEGRRSYAESMNYLLEDLHLFLKKVRKEESSHKIFLVGHSFGGQLVINYALKYTRQIDGVILSSPNIRLKLKIPFLKRLAAPILSKWMPTLILNNELDPRTVSRDPRVVEAYKNDKRIQKRITARLGDILLSNQLTLMDQASHFKVPALFMHAGEDAICSPQGTEEFFEKIPVKDKTLKIYPGHYHELFNDLDREKVFKDMESWIEERI